MIKELVILTITVLAVCQAVPVEDSEPASVPAVVPVARKTGDDLEGDDLVPEASAWGGWGGRRYYGGGWGHGYRRGWGGRGYGYGGGWGGGYRGYGHGYGGGWGYWG